MLSLHAQQRRILRRNRLRRWGLVMLLGVGISPGPYAVYWALFAIPASLRLSSDASIAEVKERLGAPTREWAQGAFECYPSYPCDLGKARGPVLIYWRMGIGHYAFFGADGRMFDFDVTGS